MSEELVSIGVPSYNRPEMLKKTLDGILKQSYKNLEIIVNDNCSPDPTVDQMIRNYAEKDNRIQYFRQEENNGPFFSMPFLYHKFSGKYFMWVCDDDYFISDNLIEELVKQAPDNILTFSSFIMSRDVQLDSVTNEVKASDVFSTYYQNCSTKMDYITSWLSNRNGYPMYGMYNRELMDEYGFEFYNSDLEKNDGMAFGFTQDIVYYNEGLLLSNIFLTGKAQFVPNVFMYMDNNSRKPEPIDMILSFIEYSDRTVKLFNNSDLSNEEKEIALKLIKDHKSNYLYNFFKSLDEETKEKIFYKILDMGILKSDYYQLNNLSINLDNA